VGTESFNMMIGMKMPDLANTESQVKVLRWLVEPGSAVKRGQPLLEVETDKATMEVECITTGVLRQIVAQPDEEVDVGTVIAKIEVEDAPPQAPTLPQAPATADDAAAAPPSPPPAAPKRTGGMFARNRATRQNRPKDQP